MRGQDFLGGLPELRFSDAEGCRLKVKFDGDALCSDSWESGGSCNVDGMTDWNHSSWSTR